MITHILLFFYLTITLTARVSLTNSSFRVSNARFYLELTILSRHTNHVHVTPTALYVTLTVFPIFMLTTHFSFS